MKKKFVLSVSMALLVLTGCGKGKGSNDASYPENFGEIGDAGRVAYLMTKATPDSVARFICYASLHPTKDVRVDSMAIATNYAYEHYKGDDLEKFGIAIDDFVASLDLADKMKIYALSGTEDPQGLGYQLGLEYMADIRDKHLSADQVEKELLAFKKACANDSDTYNRFIIGFRTVLKLDQGKDMPPAIYERFINWE